MSVSVHMASYTVQIRVVALRAGAQHERGLEGCAHARDAL